MPLVELPLIGPSYKNRELPLSAQVTKNLFPQLDPEGRNQVSLHNTAGLKRFAELEGVDRGLHVFNNVLYAVSGTSLYSIDAEGVTKKHGTIHGTARTVMANDNTQMVIVQGQIPQRFTVAGGLENITDENLTAPTTVAYMNSQFIFDQNDGNTGRFVTTSGSGITINALDFATAEGSPDDILAILTFRQLVYFFGSESIEPWENTGTGNPPWRRLSGGVAPYGIAGTYAAVVTSEFIYFLDEKRIPRRSSGFDFPSIGNPALGVEFASYSRINDVIAFAFVQDNQQFFALSFPTANRTWVFHEPSGTWFQLASGAGEDRHRASSMLHIYGLNYCSDHTNGRIYEYDLSTFTDDGEAIIRQRDTAIIHAGLFEQPGKKIYFDEVEFIIGSGVVETSGIGGGPAPDPGIVGVCGVEGDITLDGLLSPMPLEDTDDFKITAADPFTTGVSYTSSKVFSFTAAFSRGAAPTVGDSSRASLISVFKTSDAGNGGQVYSLSVHMDTDGFMRLEGRNALGITILDAKITNKGTVFTDSKLHFLAGVVDLSDPTKREIYHNGSSIAKSFVTWTTYLDDILDLADDGTADGGKTYTIGGDPDNAWTSFSSNNGATPNPSGGFGQNAAITDTQGFLSFDDSCSLISQAIWDSDKFVRDPGKWEGWYKTQPQFMFTTGLWKNSGKTAPATYKANTMELTYDNTANPRPIASARGFNLDLWINNGLLGTVSPAEPGLPDEPPADIRVERVEPFWENNGNWVDLNKLTKTTFENVFGDTIEGADFDAVFVVNKAILVNTSDRDNVIRIRQSLDAFNGSLIITDVDGDIIATDDYNGTQDTIAHTVPIGADIYILPFTDTVSAKIQKWDQTAPLDLSGTTAFEDFFDSGKFATTRISYPDFFLAGRGDLGEGWISPSGISIPLTIPFTTDTISSAMLVIPNNATAGRVEGSVSTTPFDFSQSPKDIWGLSGVIGGIVNPNTPLDSNFREFIQGETYYFNFRYLDIIFQAFGGTNGFINLQVNGSKNAEGV